MAAHLGHGKIGKTPATTILTARLLCTSQPHAPLIQSPM
jgi:hypothetical protein